MIRTECICYIDYGARCSHSPELGKIEQEKVTWPYFVRTEADTLTCEAVG